MSMAGIWTVGLLLLAGIGFLAVVIAITLLALAFIETPDDLNDVDIKGTPNRKASKD